MRLLTIFASGRRQHQLGCAAHPRRTAQARLLRQRGYCLALHAAASIETAVADLAHIPAKPHALRLGIDFFVVPTATFRLLYVFVVLDRVLTTDRCSDNAARTIIREQRGSVSHRQGKDALRPFAAHPLQLMAALRAGAHIDCAAPFVAGRPTRSFFMFSMHPLLAFISYCFCSSIVVRDGYISLIAERTNMRKIMAVAMVTIAAAQGCAAESLNTESQASPGSEVGIVKAGLAASCSDRLGELRDFAFWASSAADRALTDFEQDPSSYLARRYFGPDFTTGIVSYRLSRLIQIGRDSTLKFECVSEAEPSCANPDRALWTWDTEWQKTSDWTIYVCAERFWDEEYVNGEDDWEQASQVGIMVHELAHLTGAISDYATLDEDLLVEAASYPENDATGWAESYRFYVMKTP